MEYASRFSFKSKEFWETAQLSGLNLHHNNLKIAKKGSPVRFQQSITIQHAHNHGPARLGK